MPDKNKALLAARRKNILLAEEALKQFPGAKLGDMEECPLKHSFSGGVYVREIFIPKDTVVIGKIHKHSHPNFLLRGKVSVYTEGEGTQVLEAPLSMISTPGTKRLVYAHEDTVWITVHEVGEERDLGKIEDIVIAKDYEELEAIGEVDPNVMGSGRSIGSGSKRGNGFVFNTEAGEGHNGHPTTTDP